MEKMEWLEQIETEGERDRDTVRERNKDRESVRERELLLPSILMSTQLTWGHHEVRPGVLCLHTLSESGHGFEVNPGAREPSSPLTSRLEEVNY